MEGMLSKVQMYERSSNDIEVAVKFRESNYNKEPLGSQWEPVHIMCLCSMKFEDTESCLTLMALISHIGQNIGSLVEAIGQKEV